jgi:primosomal protein N'
VKREIEKLAKGVAGPAANCTSDDGARGVTRPTGFRDLIISGPAPAPLLRAENFYRYQIMLRTRAMSALSRELAKTIAPLTMPDDVTLAVDIDPVDLS